MDKLCDYDSASEQHSEGGQEKNEPISLAPQVDISDLKCAAVSKEIAKRDAETTIDTQQNHLTGYLQQTQIDRGKFMEQYHSF